MAAPKKNQLRRWALHAYRVAVFVFLLAMIHWQHAWFVAQKRGAMKQLVGVTQVREFFPNAASLSEWDANHGRQNVFDEAGKRLGHVIQTSPEADRVVGFSGPTNTLIAFGIDRKIRGISVLRSDDTREHLAVVLKNQAYLKQWNGLTRDEAAEIREIHGVSGATLTSTAIADGIATRLGRNRRTARFPEKISLAEIRAYVPEAASTTPREDRPNLLSILGSSGELLGYASRTSPHADHMIGYQGPTDVLLILDPKMRLADAAIRQSFDNEPFVSYVTEDEYFFNTFKGFALDEIAQLDMVDAGIDGVSGATKTSVTVAEGIIRTAGELARVRPPPRPKPLVDLNFRDVGTSLVVLAGLTIAFSHLRGNRKLRIAFQLILIGYLGFVNADMVSQALLVGWAQNGVAWRVAPGLVFLTAAALIAPIFTSRQVYCTHLCPFGAIQDLTAHRLPWKLGISAKIDRLLRLLPVILLGWVVLVAMGHLRFSLVGIEPFDAFVFRVAGWATITVAAIGLIASLFVPRAYCRYGCPTGAMLNFLRLGASSDRLGRRDFVAAGFALMAIGMMIWQ